MEYILLQMYITLISAIIAGVINSIWCKSRAMKCLQIPMDGGKNFMDGKRIFGDHKTWKGFVGYLVCNMVCMVLWGLVCSATGLEAYNMFYAGTANAVLTNLRIGFLDVSCVIYGPEKKDIMEEVATKYPDLLMISMEDVCCKIVFSSGTTAMPKAVMLSKRNLFSGMESLYKRCPFNEEDVDYLFLPLSHTYGGIYNFLYSMVFGFSIYLCSDIKSLAGELLEVNPTLFCGVPVIFRKIYEGYGNKLAYALSETASTFAIQYPYDPDVKTAGTVAEDIEVKVLEPDENGVGEIVVKGDNVFLGYAKEEALTASVFTEDGFFKTGDLGYLF